MSTDTQKKILFLDAYFEPEQTAYTHLENDLIECFANNGFGITIICPQPTRGVTNEERKDFQKIETCFNGKVVVKRFRCLKERKSVFLRAFRYYIAFIKTYRYAKKEKDIDVIFCNSTPPIQGLVATKLKKYYFKKYKRSVPFVFNLQDLFPESMVNTGISKKKSITYKIGESIAKKIYNNANQIITISNSFKDELIKKGIDNNKISVVYNWADLGKISSIERKNNKLFDELHIDRKEKIVCYAGNFGYAQDLDAIVKITKRFENSKIKFIFFGGGPLFDTYSKKIGCLSNALVFPLMPQDRISEVYSLGDVYLISCKKGLGDNSFPSKIWSILACNKYIVGIYDEISEVGSFLLDNKCGCCVDQENVEKQFNSIMNGLCVKNDFRAVVSLFGDKEKATANYLESINKSLNLV